MRHLREVIFELEALCEECDTKPEVEYHPPQPVRNWNIYYMSADLPRDKLDNFLVHYFRGPLHISMSTRGHASKLTVIVYSDHKVDYMPYWAKLYEKWRDK